MSRADRRLPSDLLPLRVESGLCLSAQGSARVKLGETEVIASIYGPRECRQHEIETDRASVRVRTYPDTRALHSVVTAAVANSLDCAAYPDTAIDVSIAIICDGGSLACCATNATVLALADAGLRLRRRVSASCFAFKDGAVLVDPTKHEEETADGVATFVFSHEDSRVISTFFQGAVSPELLVAALPNAACSRETYGKFFQ